MILITGGSGFVGREIIAHARKAGFAVRVVCRNPEPDHEVWREDRGVEIFHGNVLNPASLAGAFDGIEAVIHLVGIICEAKENTFDRVHRQGTMAVVDATKAARIKRYLHMSALGTRPNARSQYHQSKWRAEEYVRASGLEFTIFRPAVIYGPHDKSLNLFAQMLRLPLPIPVMGSGHGQWQPVPVEQVAGCFVRAIREPKAVGKTYDLVGPTPIEFNEVLDILMEVTGRHRSKLHLPMDVARLLAFGFEKSLSPPPVNRDQLLMLDEQNLGEPQPAVQDLGLQLISLADGLRKYMK